MTLIIDAARHAYRAGLIALPVAADGTKRPDVPTWRELLHRTPTIAERRAYRFETRAGYGVLAGAGIETWDFDCPEVFEAFVSAANDCGLGDLVAGIRGGYEDQTPGGGRRWIVRYPESIEWRDCTLARRPGRDGEPKVKTLIELPTFAILAPSNGATHPSGKPYVRVSGDFDMIASYTADERDTLIELARSFDQMPRPQVTPHVRRTADGTRPGDDFNARTTWPALLEPHGWRAVYTRGDTTCWCRPGKSHGISATTNHAGSDLLYVFTSSTTFDPEHSYSKFGAYTVLEHGGDFGKAARALAKQGYGKPIEPEPEPVAVATPITPCTLANVEALSAQWLHDDDPEPLRAVLAAYIANRHLDGDPVWLMVVGGSGIGKTERLYALCGMPDVVMASSISGQAALLSGTVRKERAKDASGGLLRRIPDGGGVLVLKDFTSVIDMHREARAEVLSALREIYDGRWDRLIGAEGGRTLTWTGHLGLIAGCTTAIDAAHAVTSQMGTRFVQIRIDGTSREALAGSALAQSGRESVMREALRDAARGLLTHLSGTPYAIDEEATDGLTALGAYVALARSPVDRDTQGEIRLVMDAEAPTRLVKMLGQLWRAAGLLGLSRADSWMLVRRIGLDSIPKLRRAVLDCLARHETPQNTTDIAEAIEHPSRTTRRALEDLVAHGVVARHASGPGRADLWCPSGQARAWLQRLTLPVPSDTPCIGASATAPSTGSINPLPAQTDITGKVATDERY